MFDCLVHKRHGFGGETNARRRRGPRYGAIRGGRESQPAACALCWPRFPSSIPSTNRDGKQRQSPRATATQSSPDEKVTRHHRIVANVRGQLREMRLSHSTQPHSRWQMSRHIPAETSAHTRSIPIGPGSSPSGRGCGDGRGAIPTRSSSWNSIRGAGEGFGSMPMRPVSSATGRGCGDGRGAIPTRSSS